MKYIKTNAMIYHELDLEVLFVTMPTQSPGFTNDYMTP